MVLQFVFLIRTEVFKNFLGGFEDIVLNIRVTQFLMTSRDLLGNHSGTLLRNCGELFCTE